MLFELVFGVVDVGGASNVDAFVNKCKTTKGSSELDSEPVQDNPTLNIGLQTLANFPSNTKNLQIHSANLVYFVPKLHTLKRVIFSRTERLLADTIRVIS